MGPGPMQESLGLSSVKYTLLVFISWFYSLIISIDSFEQHAAPILSEIKINL